MMRYNRWISGLLLLLIGGCNPLSRFPLVSPANAVTPPKGSKAAAFDESKGYLHKASGVGFVYPAKWQRHAAAGEETDTNLGLTRPGKAIVTLFWTEMSPLENIFSQVGKQKYDDLRTIYHEKVGKPTSLTIAGQPGYKIPINCGPMDENRTYTVGVDYVFLVRRKGRTWMIEMRASARDAATLKALQSLLANYRITSGTQGIGRS